MRYIDIDFNNLAPMYTVGRMYEANVVTLNITLPNDFEKNADYYLLEFEMPDRETFNTEPLFITDGKIKFEIPESLTQKGSLNFCVSAYKSIDTELISIEKSELVSLQFTRSIKSDGIITPAIQGFIEKIISLIEAGKIKGDKGEPGEQGPQGLKGEKGEDGKGAVSDWEQMDETADDFIKNKPFWDKSEVFTFPNADYDNPYLEIEGMPIYQICEGVPFKSLDEFDGLKLNYHYKGEPYNRSITLVKGVNVDIFEEVQTIVAPGIQCLLNPLEFDESTTIPSGIYALPDEDGNVTVIDSFVKPNIKTLDDKYIPDSVMTNDVVLYFENASFLFRNNIFKKPPFVLLSKRIDGLFYDCINLEECTINPNGLENLRACENAFSYCEKLKKIFGVLDFEYCTYIGNPFAYCYELSYIEKIVKINQDISFCHCNKLDPSTVTKILKALVASEKSHTLVLPSNIVDGLTDEQLALKPDNWILG